MGRSKSRSRSRSRDHKHKSKKEKREKREKKDKKDKKSKSHRSRSSKSRSSSIDSRSRSKSRSISHSRSGSRSKDKPHRRFDGIPKNIQNPKERKDDKGNKRFTVNNFALAGVLLETKRTNERLDKEEVARANTQFKKIDHSERQAVLLSAALSSKKEWEDKEEYYMEYRNGEYVKVKKPYACGIAGCGLRFVLSTELDEHMKMHRVKEQEENRMNKLKANEFLEKLDH